MPSAQISCEGMIDRIGSPEAILTYKTQNANIEEVCEIPNHKIGIQKITRLLLDTENGVLNNAAEIDAVGHRVVHGGNTFSETTFIDSEVKDKIKGYTKLAPLHNPANLQGIVLAEEIFPFAKQVAVFDTAFHQTIPVKAKKYAIPNALLTENDIQAYGFHGTSHKYVSEKAIAYLGKKNSKLISVHLGNGCSMTAVQNGKSVDHSMGFAPSNGLIMGTRSGDIDHSIIFHLVNSLGYSLDEVNQLLIKKSGMFGLTGFSDLRDIQTAAKDGNRDCQLALEMNAYRLKKYIGSYTAVMNGLDALIFTAGIGENSSIMRKLVCNDMDYLGIDLDHSKNSINTDMLREINTDVSRVKILVVPTNEELEIARQVFSLLANKQN